MRKIRINMLSKADMVKGQGVGSAYIEQVRLVKDGAKDIFDVVVNDHSYADIIHCHTVGLVNYFHMKCSKSVKVCYVHFLPETLDGSIKLPGLTQKLFKNYVINFYKSADYLVVVNPIYIGMLEKYGIDRNKIKYIPNYVDKDNFYKKSITEKEKIRQKLDIKKDAFVVISAGQVQMRKGVLDFVEVAKKMPDVTFIWCGGFSFGNITDGYKELKQVVDNHPSNVHFFGIINREEMNDMYNAADILFMPSYNELFPMTILEAANIKMPLLLRDLDLYKDILFNNYLSANDNDQFIETIKKIMIEHDLYNDYSNRANEISSFYSKENVLNMWREFYINIYENK